MKERSWLLGMIEMVFATRAAPPVCPMAQDQVEIEIEKEYLLPQHCHPFSAKTPSAMNTAKVRSRFAVGFPRNPHCGSAADLYSVDKHRA